MVQSAAEGEAAKEKKSDDEGENPNGEKKNQRGGRRLVFFSEKKTMEKDFKPLGRRRRPPLRERVVFFRVSVFF